MNFGYRLLIYFRESSFMALMVRSSKACFKQCLLILKMLLNFFINPFMPGGNKKVTHT